jgi:HAD superfamily hydrolase (TIGR01509 family)
MAQLQALLFDVDGTIADTEELHRQSFNQAFLRSNLKWHWSPSLYAELLGISGGHDRIAAYIDRLDVPAEEKDRLRPLIPHLHHTKTHEFGRRIEEGPVQPLAGVVRLIEEASAAGIKIGFASTSAWDNVSTLLAAAFGPSTRFKIGAITNAEMVTRKKPAPDVYELLMRMLRVPAEACVAFEDSANGVVAAHAAGAFVVATPSQWTAGQDFSRADLVLPTLGDPAAMLAADDAARIGGARWFGLGELAMVQRDLGRDPGTLHVRTS